MIAKYDLDDYIILIIYKSRNEVKILSKINLNNTLKIYNHKYSEISLDDDKDFQKILENLKITYEDYWKKNNEINTSIKLPLTLSVDSRNHKRVAQLETTFNVLDLVSDFYILKFDNKNIQYRIVYNGSPRNFLNDMSKNNFDLIMENNVWIIR